MAKSQDVDMQHVVGLPSMDEDLRAPTRREQHIAELARKNQAIAPQRYDITSKNLRALRVVYDHNGRSVTIEPGQTKPSVLLHPAMVEQLRGGDLEIVTSSE